MAQNRWFILGIAAWLGVIGAGLGLLADYAAEPGMVGEVPNTWPDNVSLERTVDTHTIVLAVHPRCPCTRSTIDELEGVLANTQATPQILALIFEPMPDESAHPEESFARTSITKRLQRLPNLQCIEDPGSTIAQHFGAMTSGHTLVYAPDDSLSFSGGLTPTRAHTGPNTGSFALKDILNGEQPIAEQAPVFGCPLCPTSEEDNTYNATLCDTTETCPTNSENTTP
jgi:hypothetical protein